MMTSTFRISIALFALIVVCVLAIPSMAVETKLNDWNDDDNCDPLSLPLLVDELGRGFPEDELINTDTTASNQSACISDSPDTPNEQVLIINQTQTKFTDLWYVADPETKLSNFDGFVNGQLAFHIDATGRNQPLVSESISADGIFEPGEAWEFIIDDYSNDLGVGAWVIDSIGVPSPDMQSSGSIIAIPEPSSFALVATLGVFALLLRRPGS